MHDGSIAREFTEDAKDHAQFNEMLESILDLDELHRQGLERARLTGTDKRLPDDVLSLTDYARAIAKEKHVEEFDPATYPHDKIKQDLFDKFCAERDELEIGVKFARTTIAELERECALSQAGLIKPEVSRIIIYSAISVLTLSMVPTLHDRVFIDLAAVDNLSAWVASISSASPMAAFVAWAQIGTFATKETSKKYMGLVAGIGIGIATGLLRITDAEVFADYLFAASLTLIEACTVLYLHQVASTITGDYQAWAFAMETIHKMNSELEAARSHLNSLEESLQKLNTEIEKHTRYVHLRWIRHNKVADIEESAIKSLLDAYDEGIAENIGRRRGIVLTHRRFSLQREKS
jgi:hypothetical protein